MFIEELYIYNRLDVNSVRTVVFLYQYALFTDVVDKAALIIRNEKLRLSACERKRKLNLGKEIAEALTRLCRDHDEFALRRQNERATAKVAFVEHGYNRLVGTTECRKQVHCNVQMLGAAFGETMEDALIISVHGRAKTAGSIALAVTEHPKVFFLCSKEQGPAWLSRIMLDYQLDDVTVCAGANLSYEDEILASGTPAEMVKKEFPSLCVAMIKNPSPRQIVRPCFLSDEDFERDKTPMTKEEIRILILHKMKLHPDDVVWDVGAGTGSVSIECARQVPFGTVHSVERSETAVKLIYKNKEKFSADNLTVYEGDAAETVAKLPEPDKVFIGGSGKEMSQILETIAAFPKKIKVVISAVTIETIAETNELLGKYAPDFDVIQAIVGRGRKIGSYHIMDTNNPVMIFTAYI